MTRPATSATSYDKATTAIPIGTGNWVLNPYTKWLIGVDDKLDRVIMPYL